MNQLNKIFWKKIGKMEVVKGKKTIEEGSKNGVKQWHLFGVSLFGRGIGEVLKLIEEEGLKTGKKPYWIATVNTEFVMETQKDRRFLDLLQKKTNLNVVDAIGLIWAKEVLKERKREGKRWLKALRVGVEIIKGKHRNDLVPGVDLVDRMCQLAEKKDKSVFFFGGWDDRSRKTAKFFKNKYPKLKIAGYRAEDFDFKTKADFLFVARAMKKQEMWIEDNIDKLKVKVVMGVGRTFDYYSGELSRAPLRLRKMGLEWLYSLYKEPKRWRRQLVLPKFIWKVLTN